VIQLGLILALVTSLLGAGVWIVQSIKDQGREECRAEHAEASRMAELRQRERGVKSVTQLGQDRTQIRSRDEAVIRDLERSTYNRACVDDERLRILNERIRQGRTTDRADGAVSAPK
jgi:hypothetical protein